MRFSYRFLSILSVTAVCLALVGSTATANQPYTDFIPTPSYDRALAIPPELAAEASEQRYGRKGGDFPPINLAPPLISSIERFDFDDLGILLGGGGAGFIPPDPHCAVGPEHVINVGNVMIQWRLKDKEFPDPLDHLELLSSFFFSGGAGIPGPPPAPGTSLGTFTFDPKVIYDQYADRFVVVSLEQWDVGCGDPSDESRILVAVSKTPDPNLGWWFHSIDSKEVITLIDHWADYPGLAIDDKAIYITNNMFKFSGGGGTFGGVRLWILDKGWYGGPNQAALVTVWDPYAVVGVATTTQPSHMYGALPVGSTGFPLGTFLCAYSGLTFGGPGAVELVQVVELTDPLGGAGGPFFVHQFVHCDDIEDVGGIFGFPPLPDAAQLGTACLIEVNDRRALNAVWRDNCLFTCATIIPNAGPDIFQTTAHWWRISTALPIPGLVVADHGNVGAEDLGPMTYTFFPSVMVDCGKNMAIGFSASNAGIFTGAYYASRLAPAPPTTIGPTCPLALGTGPYIRTYCSGRNRWGDYSGLALCPVDEATFYVYNEYACEPGLPTVGCSGPPCPTLPAPGFEDGRWCTRLGCFKSKATVSVAITSFEARILDGGVELVSTFGSDLDILGINVYRGHGDAELELREYFPGNDDNGSFRYFDGDVEPASSYRYRIGIVDPDGEFLSPEVQVRTPGLRYALYAAAPNPFNPSTTIRFELPATERVTLTIYDANGRLVRTLVSETMSHGPHSVDWNGTDNAGRSVGSGVYFYRLETGRYTDSSKMVLLK